MTLTTQRGSDNDVPVITGFQANDAARGDGRTDTADQYEKHAREVYGSMADEFLRPVSRERRRGCKGRADRRRARLAALGPVSVGECACRDAPLAGLHLLLSIGRFRGPAHPEFGAFHSGELPYAFGNLDKMDRPWEAVDHTISKMMMTYWKNMAAGGDPNGPVAAAVGAGRSGHSGGDAAWGGVRADAPSLLGEAGFLETLF